MAETIELNTLGAVIKATYEGQADTNAFTDAEKVKLAGIEDLATANSSDADLRDRSTHTGTQFAESIVDLPDLLTGKVDSVEGKDLSDENFTEEEKAKLAGLEGPHFKGTYTSLAELQGAGIVAVPGDYADVDAGLGEPTFRCIWDNTNSQWVPQLGTSTSLTGAQIKSEYEAQPDTNAFSDDERDLLASFANRHAWSDKGTWNAATNTPALMDGTGTPGDFYVVTTPGQRSFGSRLYNFELYDWIVFFRGVWMRFATNPLPMTWPNVSGKPNFDSLYAAKLRGTISPAIPAVYCGRSAAQTITNGTIHVVTWSSVVYDQFNLKSGNNFITPDWATHIRISSAVRFDPKEGGYRYIRVAKDGAILLTNRTLAISASAQTEVEVMTPILPVSAGSVFSIELWQNSGVSVDIAANGAWIQIELFTTN